MDKKGNIVLAILLALAGVLIISGGYLVYKKISSSVPGSGLSCGQDSNCVLGTFGKAEAVSVKEKVIFLDGLVLNLDKINDSRCKNGVVCIWAGELSATLTVTGGTFGTDSKEVVIGTVNNRSVSSGGYTFALQDATENSATILVSVDSEPVAKTSGTLTGYLHLGPTCPVERIPPDPNCAEKAYADAKVDIKLKSSGVLVKTLASDAKGNFRIDLVAGTYTIMAGPQAGGFLPRCNPAEAIVTADKTVNVDISCDTGIR